MRIANFDVFFLFPLCLNLCQSKDFSIRVFNYGNIIKTFCSRLEGGFPGKYYFELFIFSLTEAEANGGEAGNSLKLTILVIPRNKSVRVIPQMSTTEVIICCVSHLFTQYF
jgi:hypothetical protein